MLQRMVPKIFPYYFLSDRVSQKLHRQFGLPMPQGAVRD